jgi:hypothetical protein
MCHRLGRLGCRGGISEDPDPPRHRHAEPAHRRPQSDSQVFADHLAMRPIDTHTVAWGHSQKEDNLLKEDDAFYRGLGPDGLPVARVPFKVTAETIARGQDRFGVFCTPCHDKTGAGNGAVAQRSGGAFAGIPAWIDRS